MDRRGVRVTAPYITDSDHGPVDLRFRNERAMKCLLSMKCLLWLACAQLASAQQPSLRGTVIGAESREPLRFSIVTLIPNGGRQFTDATGAFEFTALIARTYLLSVRQIGYTPVDTQITLQRDDSSVVTIALRHLAIELPPVTITGRVLCKEPGPPDSAVDPALAAVFAQLQENARRFELFADSYPFHFRLERTLRDVTRRGDTLKTVDLLSLDNNDERPYEVGRVVSPGWGPWNSDLLVHTTVLQEFANKTFIENHCFHLVGRDTIAGETLVRIDFEPARRLAWADIAGAAYLDSITYELRFTETSLTHPERSPLTEVNTVTARTRFHNIAPGIPLQDSLIAITTYRFGRFTKRIETQRLIEVRFRHAPPAQAVR